MRRAIANFLIAFTLGLGLNVLLLGLVEHLSTAPSSVRAASFTVCPDSACDFPTVQAAIDAAGDGDIIKVAAGTYTDLHVRPRHDITNTGLVTQVVYITKSVKLRGGYNSAFSEPPNPETNPTTLNAQGQGRVIYITGNVSPTIEGFRLVGGHATGLGGGWEGGPFFDAGGGIYVITASATISANFISDNRSATGGGIFVGASPAHVEANSVVSNVALLSGGGISLANCDGALSHNTIVSNTSAYAGGGLILADSTATLNQNTIRANIADGPGGGVLLTLSDATLSGNRITHNRAGDDDNFGGDGGGLFLVDSDAVLVNNIIADNQIMGDSLLDRGSALYIRSSSPRLLHNTIARNSGRSGIYIDDGHMPSSVSLTNTILVSHTVGISVPAGHTLSLESTLWGDGIWANGTDISGAGTIIRDGDYVGDPKFVDFHNGDYHLARSSMAINKGVDAGVAIDIDGQDRNGLPDLGADEYFEKPHPITYLPIVLKE